MAGWIKLHRKFCKWEWYQKSEMVHLFLHLLLNANYEDGSWEGITIKRGQLVIGRKKISADTGISEQSVRTCMDRLKSTNEITIKSTNKYSIITILNYDSYQKVSEENNQVNNQEFNQQSTNNQPTTNHKQEYKEEKERKEDLRKEKDFFEKIILSFKEQYEIKNQRYSIGNMTKELHNAELVYKQYKENNPDSDDDRALSDLKLIFNACVNIKNDWYSQNMSLGLIASKYNQLKQILNGEQTTTQGISRGEIKTVVSQHFPTNA